MERSGEGGEGRVGWGGVGWGGVVVVVCVCVWGGAGGPLSRFLRRAPAPLRLRASRVLSSTPGESRRISANLAHPARRVDRLESGGHAADPQPPTAAPEGREETLLASTAAPQPLCHRVASGTAAPSAAAPSAAARCCLRCRLPPCESQCARVGKGQSSIWRKSHAPTEGSEKGPRRVREGSEARPSGTRATRAYRWQATLPVTALALADQRLQA